jgi:hypothetical protein
MRCHVRASDVWATADVPSVKPTWRLIVLSLEPANSTL